MFINPEVNLGHLISVLCAVVGIVITIGRLIQKLDDLRDDLRSLGSELKGHVADDARRFEEIAKVLYRLVGRIGNGDRS